jgi:Rha family phage regulatory protein
MNELVFRNNENVPVTNSLLVAQKFGKEHKNVLRDIENLSCSDDFRRLNFELSPYISLQNKKLPMYIMTKDGFTFLVMGYTGEQAGRFKEDFLNAFNKMETLLSSDDYILARSQAILQGRVKALESQLSQKESHIEVLAAEIKQSVPKVKYYNDVLSSEGLITATDIAKNYGWSAIKLNNTLHTLGVQFRQSKHWVLYAKYQYKGYAKLVPYPYLKSDGTNGTHYELKWNETGKRFIHELLKENSLIPEKK